MGPLIMASFSSPTRLFRKIRESARRFRAIPPFWEVPALFA